MMLLERLSTWLRGRFTRLEAKEEAPPQFSAAPVPSVPERPQSAVAILRNEPNLPAAELAARAGVTLSYARSLIRPQQAKPLANSLRPMFPDGGVAVLQSQVRELTRRVEHTEDRIVRPSADVSRRAQILERSTAGVASTAIAEQLSLPQGEIDFILKIERIKKSLTN
jgi:hypothetical protein